MVLTIYRSLIRYGFFVPDQLHCFDGHQLAFLLIQGAVHRAECSLIDQLRLLVLSLGNRQHLHRLAFWNLLARVLFVVLIWLCLLVLLKILFFLRVFAGWLGLHVGLGTTTAHKIK